MKLTLCIFLFLSSFVVLSQNSPPSISISTSQNYCLDTDVPIVSSVEISNEDNNQNTLDEVSIQISEGYQDGSDLLALIGSNPNITATWFPSEGKLLLSGPATYSEFENAILNVVYSSTQTNFTENKNISIILGDANFLPSTGHYYFYEPNLGITWQNAKAAAESQSFFGLQGYLATITSQEEAQICGEQSSGSGWIGASDQQNEGTWIWETGPEQGDIFWIGLANGTAPNGAFAFWNNNEPNQSGDEDYAHITDQSIGIPGAWNDLSNEGASSGPYQPKGYIVEFGGLPGEPELDLASFTTMIMPQNVIEQQDICEATNGTISVTTNADEVNWYETENSTTVLGTGSTLDISISSNTTYWVQPIYNECSNQIDRLPVFVEVLNTPDINNNFTAKECSNSNSLTIAEFELNTYIDSIVNGDTQNIDVNFYEDESLTQIIADDIYLNTFNFEVIYAVVINTQTQCSKVSEITLEVVFNDLGSFELSQCDDDTIDGITTFNLSEADNLFFETPTNDIVVNYYETYDDALMQINPLPDNYENTTTDQDTIFARVNNTDGCLGLGELNLIVDNLPSFEVSDDVYYCLNSFPDTITLETGIQNLDDYTLLWSTGETTESIQVNEADEYSVEITNSSGCSLIKNINVLPSEIPIIDKVEIDDFKSGSTNSITIIASGIGNTFDYSIDGINYQSSNTFENLVTGDYTVYVRDKNGCGENSRLVYILEFPDFFTPNADGINDTWQIVKPNSDRFIKIHIFDRYGKFLGELNPSNKSWDGTFNGKTMPSNDYWFKAERDDGKVFSGHFTLKR